jgi:hypothetical protein
MSELELLEQLKSVIPAEDVRIFGTVREIAIRAVMQEILIDYFTEKDCPEIAEIVEIYF